MSAQPRLIKLSVRGLAKYIVASPAGQRRVLEDFKYAAGDEPFAMRTYYREAKQCIKSFDRSAHPSDWLRQQASLISTSSQHETGRTAQRLEQNARAIRQYQQLFSGRNFEVLGPCRFRLTFFDVAISVVPDLHIREGNTTKLFKVQFGGPPEKDRGIQVMTQCVLEAANIAGYGLPNTSVIYLDLPRGVEHHAPRSGAKILRDVKAACQTISQLWDLLPPPTRTSRRSAVA